MQESSTLFCKAEANISESKSYYKGRDYGAEDFVLAKTMCCWFAGNLFRMVLVQRNQNSEHVQTRIFFTFQLFALSAALPSWVNEICFAKSSNI